jgi:hypothetical protein
MKYRQDLQVRLRNRYARLIQTAHQPYPHEMRLVCDWIRSQPALSAIVDAAVSANPDVSVEEWLVSGSRRSGLTWPEGVDERGRAALVWLLMDDISRGKRNVMQVAGRLSHETNLNDSVRTLTQSVVQHLIDYLGEQLGTDSEMLYLLERYKRQVEWFDRAALHAAYEKDTRAGEAGYDEHLRRFLFSQGVDNPLTQSRGPSGETDVLGNLDSDDPLVCEVKLFDARDKGKREVAGGLNQAVQYAHDYGKAVAYLVVVNLSGRDLQIPSDGEPGVWPPRIEIAGVTVHIVTVRALPVPTASKQGKAKPVVFTRADLTEAD